MEKIVEQGMLYDFYGELLTEHQKQIYEEAVYEDFSLSEIAEKHGISRQGVHDLIKRVTKILNDYEDKLHLVEKFMDTKSKVHEINELTNQYLDTKDIKQIHKIQNIAQEILDDF